MHIDHVDMNQVVHAAIFFFDKDYVYTHMHDEWMDGCAPEVCTEMQIHVEKIQSATLISQDVIPPCQTAIYRNVGDLHSRRPPAP